MFWEEPPETGAKSSRQEAEPEGREQPSRESSPIKGSVVQWKGAQGKHENVKSREDTNYIKYQAVMLVYVFGSPLIMSVKDFVLKSQYSIS